MAIVNVSQDVSTQVVVKFVLQDGDFTYSDALYFTPEDYKVMTQKDLDALQVKRFDAWKVVVTTPRIPPTPQEKLAYYNFLLDQRVSLDKQIADAAT